MRIKKCVLIYLLPICLGILILYFLFIKFWCKNISCINTTPLSILRVQDIYENSTKSFRGLYVTKDGLFRVEKYTRITPQEAEHLTTVSLMTIQGVFENAHSPYPGPLSDEITCDNKYKPQPYIYQQSSLTMTVYSGYFNDRLQYGSCINDQITHKGYVAIFYCNDHHAWYKTELLIPIQEATQDEHYYSLIQSIRCNGPLQLFHNLFL